MKKIIFRTLAVFIVIILILFLTLFIALSNGFSGFQKEYINDKDRDILDYYSGIVVDKNNKPVNNVKVSMYIIDKDSNKKDKNKTILTTTTNEKGYFEIKDKTKDSLHILYVQTEKRELFFEKKGYKLDSARTNTGQSSYRPLYDSFDGCHFIFKIPDTLVLEKNK